MTVLVCGDADIAAELAAALGEARPVARVDDLAAALQTRPDDLVVMGPDVDLDEVRAFSAQARITNPLLGVVAIRTRLDTEVLTRALQAGVREVVQAGDAAALQQACESSRALSRQFAQAHAGLSGDGAVEGTVITVFGSKGGCGKTMLSTNLAVAMAEAGRRTCLVDLDLAFGDVAIALQLFPEHTIADAIPMVHSLDPAGVRSLMTEHPSGLHALLAPIEPSISEQVPVELISGLLTVLKQVYEVVVVDTAPAFTEHVLAAFDASDRIVLVTTPDIPAVKNLKLALQTLDQLGSPAQARVLVLNRSDAQVGLTVPDVRKLLGSNLSAEIPSHRAVPASITRGIPLVQEQPSHSVSKAVVRLADHLLPATEQSEGSAARHSASDRKPGLFRRKVATT